MIENRVSWYDVKMRNSNIIAIYIFYKEFWDIEQSGLQMTYVYK